MIELTKIKYQFNVGKDTAIMAKLRCVRILHKCPIQALHRAVTRQLSINQSQWGCSSFKITRLCPWHSHRRSLCHAKSRLWPMQFHEDTTHNLEYIADCSLQLLI